MADLWSSEHNRKKSINSKRKSFIELVSIRLLQSDHDTDVRALDLNASEYSSLSAKNELSLILDIQITSWGYRLLSSGIDTVVSCQAQAFMKPLSPIGNNRLWKSRTSTALTAAREKYTLMFHPFKMGCGVYAFQLILLTTGIQSLPIFFERSVIEVS